jgi:hypothetical protein
MNDITPEQAPQIHDISSYKTVTGAKRFRRTKEESALGLSPEEALQGRLREANDLPAGAVGSVDNLPRPRGGDIVIRIKPAAGVDRDYFERLPRKEIEIALDNSWYGWYDELTAARYDGKLKLLFQHMLDLGIGEVITTYPEKNDERA